MQTDPISAAAGYRMALERIKQARSLQEARQHAREALEITFKRPAAEEIHVSSGLGGATGAAFVTVAMSAPAVQLVTAQARAVALQILEAADAAESDAFLVHFAAELLGEAPAAAASLLADFRAFRQRLRQAEEPTAT